MISCESRKSNAFFARTRSTFRQSMQQWCCVSSHQAAFHASPESRAPWPQPTVCVHTDRTFAVAHFLEEAVKIASAELTAVFFVCLPAVFQFPRRRAGRRTRGVLGGVEVIVLAPRCPKLRRRRFSRRFKLTDKNPKPYNRFLAQVFYIIP